MVHKKTVGYFPVIVSVLPEYNPAIFSAPYNNAFRIGTYHDDFVIETVVEDIVLILLDVP